MKSSPTSLPWSSKGIVALRAMVPEGSCICAAEELGARGSDSEAGRHPTATHSSRTALESRSTGEIVTRRAARAQEGQDRIQDSGFRIQDSGFRIQDSVFRIQDSGFVA